MALRVAKKGHGDLDVGAHNLNNRWGLGWIMVTPRAGVRIETPPPRTGGGLRITPRAGVRIETPNLPDQKGRRLLARECGLKRPIPSGVSRGAESLLAQECGLKHPSGWGAERGTCRSTRRSSHSLGVRIETHPSASGGGGEKQNHSS